PAATDTTSTVVNLLPSTATNSVTESYSTTHSSPASKTTTLTTSASSPTKVAPAKSSPQNSPVAQSSSLKVNTQPDVGPLVDLSDTPKPPPRPTLYPLCQSQSAHPLLMPMGHRASVTQSKPLTAPRVRTYNGKTVKDDNTKGETEVKNATAEVKTVPNEAPQMNGNESKA
ncbi:hypothetical protein INR49_027637, partial [Caranx melampygus]